MGWATGSEMMEEIIGITKKCVPEKCRKYFYIELIKIFQNYDCDTLMECEGMDRFYDLALKKCNLMDEE